MSKVSAGNNVAFSRRFMVQPDECGCSGRKRYELNANWHAGRLGSACVREKPEQIPLGKRLSGQAG